MTKLNKTIVLLQFKVSKQHKGTKSSYKFLPLWLCRASITKRLAISAHTCISAIPTDTENTHIRKETKK
jgi:hypothetical protein